MKLSVSFKDLENHKSVEKEMENAVKKLNVLLKTYQPDLVQLHAVFAKLPRNDEHTLTLNLTLPTGTLHATASSEHIGACCKKAFHEIESQVKKHKSLLRKDYEWKRNLPHIVISIRSEKLRSPCKATIRLKLTSEVPPEVTPKSRRRRSVRSLNG